MGDVFSYKLTIDSLIDSNSGENQVKSVAPAISLKALRALRPSDCLQQPLAVRNSHGNAVGFFHESCGIFLP